MGRTTQACRGLLLTQGLPEARLHALHTQHQGGLQTSLRASEVSSSPLRSGERNEGPTSVAADCRARMPQAGEALPSSQAQKDLPTDGSSSTASVTRS